MKKIGWMIGGMALMVLVVGGFAYLGKTSSDKLSSEAPIEEQAYESGFQGDLPLLAGMETPGRGRGAGKGLHNRHRQRDEFGQAGKGRHRGGHLARAGDRGPREKTGKPGRRGRSGDRDRMGRPGEPGLGGPGAGMRPGRHMERIKQSDPERYERLEKIRDLAEEYRTTDSESRKKDIEKELRPLVEKELKVQHENNKERIERLEQRLKEMKRVMKAREKNWDKVVNYTVEDITGQKEYLKAWPGSRMRHRRGGPRR